MSHIKAQNLTCKSIEKKNRKIGSKNIQEPRLKKGFEISHTKHKS